MLNYQRVNAPLKATWNPKNQEMGVEHDFTILDRAMAIEF